MLWPVSAKAVIVRDGAVLLARNDRDEWELPGGRVERGEEPVGAVVREVAEETGLLVHATSQLGVASFEVTPGTYVLIVAYACTVTQERELVLSDEHTALRWQPLPRLGDLALPRVYRDLIALAVRGRVVLVGDSHLAKLDRSQLQRLSDRTTGSPLVVNHAAGGSSVLDLLAEVEFGSFLPQDRIVISVGTNDFAPWKRVPLPQFQAAVEDLLDRLHHHRLVIVLPPPVDTDRQIEAGRPHLRSEQDRAPYASALEAAAAARGTQIVRVSGSNLHATDGVHLSPAGYDVLISRLARALNTGA